MPVLLCWWYQGQSGNRASFCCNLIVTWNRITTNTPKISPLYHLWKFFFLTMIAFKCGFIVKNMLLKFLNVLRCLIFRRAAEFWSVLTGHLTLRWYLKIKWHKKLYWRFLRKWFINASYINFKKIFHNINDPYMCASTLITHYREVENVFEGCSWVEMWQQIDWNIRYHIRLFIST